MSTPVTISDWKPRRQNSLRGFCVVHLPSGMTLCDVSIHESNGVQWASPASKPMLTRDGAAMRDDAGKIRYQPIVSFETKAHRDRFSAGVIEALLRAHPEALT